jgi:hypothetical protein
VPDDVLGRIDGVLEDWERGPDVARWHADGGPDDLAEWVAYCAPGRRAGPASANDGRRAGTAVPGAQETTPDWRYGERDITPDWRCI